MGIASNILNDGLTGAVIVSLVSECILYGLKKFLFLVLHLSTHGRLASKEK